MAKRATARTRGVGRVTKQGPKFVYTFEEAVKAFPNLAERQAMLGNKGANLVEMTEAGLPVPPGFNLTTDLCRQYLQEGKLPREVEEQLREALRWVERETGKRFGDPKNPLLVSVRSGAVVSMPGMMDTILNLGLNDKTVEGLAFLTGDERFAYDAYRRFITMFGSIALGIKRDKFEAILEEVKREYGVQQDPDVPAEGMKEVVGRLKKLYEKEVGKPFPQDPWEQLITAIEAVFRSWNNPRAIAYRNIHGIPHDAGTGCSVQTMVFGNMGWDSGTGVAFTRSPATGEKAIFGEYLSNAQGEDVVAGIRTPFKIEELKRREPTLYNQLEEIASLLERHFRDMQDIEFTVEKGKLYMLQTRAGKRTAQADVKMAVDMAEEGLITKEEAVRRVNAAGLEALLRPRIDISEAPKPIAKGLPASPGAATGKVIFDSDEAAELGSKGERIILVRHETSPDDVHGMAASQGILTSRGGMTAHAAVVARGMGKPCVVGCSAVVIDYDKQEFRVGDLVVKKGEIITIDGFFEDPTTGEVTGAVFLGEVPLIEPQIADEFEKLMNWADDFRRLGVMANADLPEDAQRAFELGAEGIGLARTEHMFLGPGRVEIVREAIMAEEEKGRRKALERLLPVQREDFVGLLKAMQGRPVIIRLLDPPLHEFLPRVEDLQAEVMALETAIRATEQSSGPEVVERARLKELLEERRKMLRRARILQEANPMMGLRGCRVGIVFPEIYEMQVRAIYEAAAIVKREGIPVKPEVMIPLTSEAREMKLLRERLEKVAREVLEREGIGEKEIPLIFGTMVETPRAALTASEVAEYSDFFSFGTNDLTQMTFGFSRDDAEAKFMAQYLEEKVLEKNPFQVLDQTGVGRLIEIGVKEGKAANPKLEIGICGEHGGDPESIRFCHKVGLDYVSCSPFRVPVARLAAAQVALEEMEELAKARRVAAAAASNPKGKASSSRSRRK